MKSLYLSEWNAFIRYYEIADDGRTVVYLPAISFPSVANFLSIATHLEMPKHRAIFVDNLGAGLSDHSETFSYSMEDHAQTVASILDHEDVKDAIIVGHSMGGTVAIMLALSRPDLVSNLVVSEGNITPGGGKATREIASYSKDEYINEVFPRSLKKWSQAAIEGDTMAIVLSNAWSKADAAGLHSNSKALVELDPSLKGQYLNLTIPRTFIYGERSLPENSGGVGADAPDPSELKAHGIQIGVIPNAGHLQMFENLDGYVEALVKAIRL
jgi:pimeloyl-ACP methyl ester carboxylesterase